MAKLHNFTLYRVFRGKSASVPKVKLRRYNKQNVNRNLNYYGKKWREKI